MGMFLEGARAARLFYPLCGRPSAAGWRTIQSQDGAQRAVKGLKRGFDGVREKQGCRQFLLRPIAMA